LIRKAYNNELLIFSVNSGTPEENVEKHMKLKEHIGGIRRTTLFILNLGCRWTWVLKFVPLPILPLPHKEPFYSFLSWGKGKHGVPCC